MNTVTFAGVFNNQDKRFLEKLSAQGSARPHGRPERLHGTIVFLMSDASRYMTGSNVVVDGGFTAM